MLRAVTEHTNNTVWASVSAHGNREHTCEIRKKPLADAGTWEEKVKAWSAGLGTDRDMCQGSDGHSGCSSTEHPSSLQDKVWGRAWGEPALPAPPGETSRVLDALFCTQ